MDCFSFISSILLTSVFFNLSCLHFYLRQFFFSDCINFCAFILDIIQNRIPTHWVCLFFPLIYKSFFPGVIYRKKTVQWNFFAVCPEGQSTSNVRFWRSSSSSRNNFVNDKRIGTRNWSEPCLWTAGSIQFNQVFRKYSLATRAACQFTLATL